MPVRHISPYNPHSSPACNIDVVRCDSCGTLRLDPRPDDEALLLIQESAHHLEAGNVNPGYPPMFADSLRQAGFPASRGRLLDVGCGGGDLLDAVAAETGARATGLDVSERAIARARSRFPEHDWVVGRIEERALPEKGGFDAAMIVRLLEHLPDPVGDLRTIRKWLLPGGLLLVDVPDGEYFFSRPYSILLESPKPILAWLLRLAGRRAPFTKRGFYPYHLTLFGEESLRKAVVKAGFEVLESGISTCRLEHMLGESRRRRAWLRWTVDRLKLAMARRGLGETLYLVARKPPSRSPLGR
jgi:2-polyprenyl-3-methyl-5-hydroxy-6-metoxy-1,4-benzoquinol methylase